jgi:hypothetical protein
MRPNNLFEVMLETFRRVRLVLQALTHQSQHHDLVARFFYFSDFADLGLMIQLEFDEPR